jgi:hypothetical protein
VNERVEEEECKSELSDVSSLLNSDEGREKENESDFRELKSC